VNNKVGVALNYLSILLEIFILNNKMMPNDISISPNMNKSVAFIRIKEAALSFTPSLKTVTPNNQPAAIKYITPKAMNIVMRMVCLVNGLLQLKGDIIPHPQCIAYLELLSVAWELF